MGKQRPTGEGTSSAPRFSEALPWQEPSVSWLLFQLCINRLRESLYHQKTWFKIQLCNLLAVQTWASDNTTPSFFPPLKNGEQRPTPQGCCAVQVRKPIDIPPHSPRPGSPLGPTQSSAQCTAGAPQTSVQGAKDRRAQILTLGRNKTSQTSEQDQGCSQDTAILWLKTQGLFLLRSWDIKDSSSWRGQEPSGRAAERPGSLWKQSPVHSLFSPRGVGSEIRGRGLWPGHVDGINRVDTCMRAHTP